MTDRDNRADARDRRFGDFDGAVGVGRDDDDRIGRSTLFDFEDAEAQGRRDPYAEWLERGSTPTDAIAEDFPQLPTRIGDWHYRTLSSATGSVTRGGYRVLAADFEAELDDARPYVVINDGRHTPRGGIHAYLTTEQVQDPAGSPPHPPIVSADDPETFAHRLVSHLDGIQPDDAVHPRYDPVLERDLPDPFEFDLLLPLRTKTTYRWSGMVTDDGRGHGWVIDAEGSTNRRMSVFAYPAPSLGERAPRSIAESWDVSPMPGDGVGPAAETARRIMRAILEDPARNRGGTGADEDRTPRSERDSLRFDGPDIDPIEFFAGDRVRVMYDDRFTDQPEVLGGELEDWGVESDGAVRILIRGHEGEEIEVRGGDVSLDGTFRGTTPGTPPIALTKRGD